MDYAFVLPWPAQYIFMICEISKKGTWPVELNKIQYNNNKLVTWELEIGGTRNLAELGGTWNLAELGTRNLELGGT